MKKTFFKLSAILNLALFVVSCSKDVPPKPVADFSYTEMGGGKIVFTNLSKDANTYRWDFGDGRTNNAMSVENIYQYNGTYTVTLTASSEHGQDNITRVIKVASAPTTGNFVFWTTCQNTKDILVYVSGTYRNKITAYYPLSTSSAPACNSQYNVTVNLPEGTYNYTAQTDELFPTKWSGQITVMNGQCRSLKLICN